MASPTGGLDTSADSQPSNFSSFSNLLAGAEEDGFPGDVTEGFSDQPGHGEGRKFRHLMPISPPPISPSSFFSIPSGLSPAFLLDSPMLLPPSHVMQSPTTGSFPTQPFNWKGIKHEENEMAPFPDFSFNSQQQPWIQQDHNNNPSEIREAEANTRDAGNGGGYQSYQTLQRRSDDGYNWRKYGQKQVKGSENPRSYYKCTYPNCPTKKKVERCLEGRITEIVYKGSHNHPKPLNTRRNSGSSHPAQASEHSFGAAVESVATPDDSSVSLVEDDVNVTKSGGDEFEEDKPDAKRWKRESDEGISASGNRTVRESRVVVQTTSDIDILDDGYRWRKYGQKVVKGNPNPRSYYKCTTVGCPVRKHVERASHDLRAVITTYEGKHNHDVPAARGSGGHRPAVDRSNFTMATRPSAIPNHPNQMATTDSFFGGRQAQTSGNQAPITLEMLQTSQNYGFNGFDNSMNPYANHHHHQQQQQQQQQQQRQLESIMFSRAKDEQREDFIESLLC